MRPWRVGLIIVAVAAASCGENDPIVSTRADSTPAPTTTSASTSAPIATSSTTTGSTTSAPIDPLLTGLEVVEPEGTVDVSDLSAGDLYDASSDGLLFLDGELLMFAGIVDGIPTVVDLGSVIDPFEDLLPIPFPIALCGDMVVASVRGPSSDQVVAVEAATGAERWRVASPDPEGGHAVACGSADVVVTYDGRGTVALDLADGSVAWTSDVEPDDPPNAAGDMAVIGSYDGVVVLDLATGEERWRAADSSASAPVIGPQGVIIDVGVPTLFSPSGDQVASFDTLHDDVVDVLQTSFSYLELRIAGPVDSPVLVLLGGPIVVELDGSLRSIDEFGDPSVEIVGVSGELVWIARRVEVEDAEDRTTIERVRIDGTVVDSIEIDRALDPIVATDELLLGSTDDGPMVVVVG